MPSATAPVVVFATRLGAVTLTDGAKPQSWIQVGIAGDFEDPRYGKFSITKDHLRQMHANFSGGKYPEPPTEICIDYEHLTLKEDVRPGDTKAAGWFKQLELRNDDAELWALIEWTADAAESIKAGEYRFVSPAYRSTFKTIKGEDIGCTLVNAAITNTPALQGMAPVTLRRPSLISLAMMGDNDKRMRVAEGVRQQFGAAYEPYDCWLEDIYGDVAVFCKRGQLFQVSFSIADDGTVSFSSDPVEVIKQYAPLGAGVSQMSQKNLISLKAADGKDVQIDLAALEETPLVKELRSKLPKEGEKVVPAGTVDDLTGKITALTAQVATLGETVTGEKTKREAVELQLNTDRANAKVTKLLTEGKLVPAQTEWAQKYALSNPADFDAFAATLQPVVKLGGGGHGTGGAPVPMGDAEAQLTAKAVELRTADPKLTDEAAYQLACEKNPDLYEKVGRE